MNVVKMRNFVRENRLRGYTRHRRRDDLITFLRNNYQPASTPTPRPQPPSPTWEPTGSQCTRPHCPMRAPPPAPAPPSARFRQDRPRQIEERNPQPVRPILLPASRPYQLKPKRGQEFS